MFCIWLLYFLNITQLFLVFPSVVLQCCSWCRKWASQWCPVKLVSLDICICCPQFVPVITTLNINMTHLKLFVFERFNPSRKKFYRLVWQIVFMILCKYKQYISKIHVQILQTAKIYAAIDIYIQTMPQAFCL